MDSMGMTGDQVTKNVGDLTKLVNDFLDNVYPAMYDVKHAQGIGRWTDLDECKEFRIVYANAMLAADANVRAVWDDVYSLVTNMSASANTNQEVEDTIRNDLTALLTKMEDKRPENYSPDLIAAMEALKAGALGASGFLGSTLGGFVDAAIPDDASTDTTGGADPGAPVDVSGY